jgi:hypothetical protein
VSFIYDYENEEEDNQRQNNLTSVNNLPRRPTRNKTQTKFYQSGETMTQIDNKANCAYFHEHDEPKNIEDAFKSKIKENCKEAIASEFKSLDENKTWTVSNLPAGKRTIKTKWIF